MTTARDQQHRFAGDENERSPGLIEHAGAPPRLAEPPEPSPCGAGEGWPVLVAASCRSSRSSRAGRVFSARLSTTPRMRFGADRLRRALHHRVRRRLRRHDQQRRVDHRRQQVGVGQDRDRRRVDDDPVERVLARPRAAASSPARPAGSSDPAATRPAVSTHSVGVTWCTGSLPSRGIARLSVRPSVARQREHFAHARAAQVGVDQQHAPLIRLAQRQREVGRGQRLAFGRQRARHHHAAHARRLLRVVHHRGEMAVLLDQRADRRRRRRSACRDRRRRSAAALQRRRRPRRRRAGGVGGRPATLASSRRASSGRQRLPSVRGGATAMSARRLVRHVHRLDRRKLPGRSAAGGATSLASMRRRRIGRFRLRV